MLMTYIAAIAWVVLFFLGQFTFEQTMVVLVFLNIMAVGSVVEKKEK